MEPRIQYVKTKDGVSIAYFIIGNGPPFIHMPPPPFSHIQLEWEIPQGRRWFEGLAESRRVIRYDGRGTGLSDRDVTDYSLDARILELEALADRLGQETFALFAPFNSGPVAIAYATRHPERVSHLLLWCSPGRRSDRVPSGLQGLAQLMESNWELYTQTLAHSTLGWTEGEMARRYAALMRECVHPEAARASIAAADEFDVSDLLPQVSVPTLVLHRREVASPHLTAARGLASHIADAQLVLLEGNSMAPYLGDMQSVLTAIDEFLDQGEEAATKTELPEGMAVILFADIANSTALTEQLGDAGFREKARELDASLRAIIGESGGTPVEGKVLGDGVLAVFTSARQAIDCALRCNANSEPPELQLHLGIHAGDVIRERNNVYGGAVNIAARIAGASAPGELLVSDTVRSLARTSAGVTFDDRGEHALKGVADPQRLFAVRERGA